MNFNTSWDLDQHRTEHECEEHWELRRSFMEAHKNKFSEERLVCLAQVFTNVEFLGCRYPTETMQLVAELSQGVADSYREKQKGKLQRTFVKASDAAGAKVKGLKRSTGEEDQSSSEGCKHLKTKNSSVSSQSNSPLAQAENSQSGTYQPSSTPTVSNVRAETVRTFDASRYGGVRTYHIDSAVQSKKEPLIKEGPFGKLILIEEANTNNNHPTSTLQRSLSACRVPSTYEYENQGPRNICCKLFVNGKLLSEAVDFSNRAARDKVSRQAVDKLGETCYTLRIKAKFFSESTIDKSLEEVRNNNKSLSDDLQECENIGSKLMRLMGWTGGGLGKDQQGIQEPVTVSERVNRCGLGLTQGNSPDNRQFKDKIYRLLRSFADKDSENDLVFSSDFTSEERKTLHQIAQKFNLKTKSYGKNNDRHLVISKKFDFLEMVEQMAQSGKTSEKYEIISPKGPSSH